MLLINAVKDVASALTDLITKSKTAAGKAANDATMVTLKDSATVGNSDFILKGGTVEQWKDSCYAIRG